MKMHILFFIYSLSAGGAERVTAMLANHWAKKGWLVTIVTITGLDCDFYTLDANVHRIALNLDADSASAWQAVRDNVRRVTALRKILKRNKPDVAVGMMATANCLLALAGRRVGGMAIGSERIHPPALRLEKAWHTLRRWTYPRLDGLVAQTRSSARWLETHTAPRKVEVIPNPVHFPLPCQEPVLDPESVKRDLGAARILLGVGRLEKQKGFDRLLNAFSSLSSRYPDWGMVILGEGALRAELEKQATALGIAARVRLPGAVGNIGQWYEAADLYALTSRFEGFPNTLLEALACGVPAVAVDCETGPGEILRDGTDGLLIPQDHPKALADALKRLMRDAELRNRFSRHAVAVRERFAVERIVEQWEQLFRELGKSGRQ